MVHPINHPQRDPKWYIVFFVLSPVGIVGFTIFRGLKILGFTTLTFRELRKLQYSVNGQVTLAPKTSQDHHGLGLRL